jgi:hypothetical protein
MKSLPALISGTFLLCIALSPAIAQSVTAEDAKNHIGEKATVCGKVANQHIAANSAGHPTFIDLDSAYPNRIFTILVWGNDKLAVGELPSLGSRVCVTGLIQNYRGVPQIAVWSRDQLSR